AYIAPEQLGPAPGRNRPAADQYSLGVVFYELLTGQLPFEGPPAAVLYQVAHTEPRRPRQIRGDISAALEAICLTAMAKDPGQRYPSCAALRDDLKRWLDGKRVSSPRLAAPWLLGLGALVAAIFAAWLLKLLPAAAPSLAIAPFDERQAKR